MRLILDTNLLISALISPHGAPAQLIDAWNDDRFVLISSLEQLEEFREVSRRERLAALIQRSDAGTFRRPRGVLDLKQHGRTHILTARAMLVELGIP